jgi:putative tricarboxylic transport membrane protein
VCKRIDFPVAPMAFTLILGPLTEKALRQALSMSGGDPAVFARSWLSTGLLAAAALALLGPLLAWLWRRAARGRAPS